MKKLIPLLLLLAGCQPSPTQQMAEKPVPGAAILQESPRFSVTRVGVFRDTIAYDDVRGIYLIKDTETGREYVGVSGVGISETGSHMVGKVRQYDER